MVTGDFPLQVNYEEKCMWLGSFGGFMKLATPTARLIDRPIRPMFAKGNEVQVINTVLLTMKMHLDQCSKPCLLFGTSFYLRYSIWRTNRWGRLCGWGSSSTNPSSERSLLEIDSMRYQHVVESPGAKELSEEIMLEAPFWASTKLKNWLPFQEEVVSSSWERKKAEVVIASCRCWLAGNRSSTTVTSKKQSK